MERTFFILGATLAALAVALGAFGAHTLVALLIPNARQWTYDTAVQYQMFHALGLFVVAYANRQFPSRLTIWAGWLFVAGIILFSGSLYILSIFEIRFVGAIAPLGGIAFILGWVVLGLSAWRDDKGQ